MKTAYQIQGLYKYLKVLHYCFFKAWKSLKNITFFLYGAYKSLNFPFFGQIIQSLTEFCEDFSGINLS